MNKKIDTLNVNIFNENIGKIAFDVERNRSFFQYNKEFLYTNRYKNIFPFLIKRINQVQIFSEYNSKTFKGLPPMIADSLPDDFGNRIFNEWMKSIGKKIGDMSPVEQLSYLSDRGMGALEYTPAKILPNTETVNINDITKILKEILDVKKDMKNLKLNDLGLLNIFKLGTSAGGARAKVIVSENKEDNTLIPGDITSSEDYNHYLVKLNMDSDSYNREKVEFSYYQMALEAGIHMMPSKIIDNKHFATLRFDRQNGRKQHVLTVTGISGLDYLDKDSSSYENVFEVAHQINVPSGDIDKLFRRMVFNFAFHNIDDHLKNHSFIYNEKLDKWNLTPAYDVNYSLDALNKWVGAQHSLSLNKKRINITKKDLIELGEKYSVYNPEKIIKEVLAVESKWNIIAAKNKIPSVVIESIAEDFKSFNSKELHL